MKHDQENETETVNVSIETMQPSVMEAMERAQIDVQISTAKRYPRSMEVFKRRAEEMVSLDEEVASSCLYRRPVGKKQVDGKWVEEFAEGESVRMAEIVGACYGNIRVSAKIIEQTPRYVKCVGMAHDLESNFASQAEVVEATVTKNGQPYSERMGAVVAKACLSKAWRDALFRVVPKGLCKTISNKARAVAIGDETTLEKRRGKANEWVTKCGIHPNRVWSALGIKGPADLTLDHLETLTGIKTAIKDKDTTLDEAFPEIKFDTQKVEPPAGKGKSSDDHPPGLDPQNHAQTATGTTQAPPDSTDDDKEAHAEIERNRLAAEAKRKADAEAKAKAEASSKSTAKPKAPDWVSERDKPALLAKLESAGLTQAQLCQYLKQFGILNCNRIEDVEGMAPKKLAIVLFKFDELKAEIAAQPGKSAV